MVLFIKVILQPLDKFALFHPTRQCSIFSITPSQIDLALKWASNGRPRYFIGKEDTAHPRILDSVEGGNYSFPDFIMILFTLLFWV
jgi:hypothetical protein